MMGIWPFTAQPAHSVGGVRLAEIADKLDVIIRKMNSNVERQQIENTGDRKP